VTTGRLRFVVAVVMAVLIGVLIGGTLPTPDLGWALGSLRWSVIGFLVGIGAGYLLWGRKDAP